MIHVASPLSGRGDAESTIDVGVIQFSPAGIPTESTYPQSAVLGSTNVLRQAIDAGIKRFSVASSVAAAMDFTKGKTWERLTEDGMANRTFRTRLPQPLTPQPDRSKPCDARTRSRE